VATLDFLPVINTTGMFSAYPRLSLTRGPCFFSSAVGDGDDRLAEQGRFN
jgi:hypothetical protein